MISFAEELDCEFKESTLLPIINSVIDHESSPPIPVTRSAFYRTLNPLKQQFILPIYEATASVAVPKPSTQVRSDKWLVGVN